ncbi:unannotated protein [freshwater metagenome]|uniref:Unannotated protein n=1 Tax=freshwater metagenome TaxID=449393 RepID=A0A6J5YDA4_9ZZZZ
MSNCTEPVVGTASSVQLQVPPLITAVHGACTPPRTEPVSDVRVRFTGSTPVSTTSETEPVERRNTSVGTTGLDSTVNSDGSAELVMTPNGVRWLAATENVPSGKLAGTV